jgi:hypothetical protein
VGTGSWTGCSQRRRRDILTAEMLVAAFALSLLAPELQSLRPVKMIAHVTSDRATPTSFQMPAYFGDGTITAPLRPIASILRGYVYYTPRLIYMVATDRSLAMKTGSRAAREKAGQTVNLSLPLYIVGNVAYVPLRSMLEYFGAHVYLESRATPLRVSIHLASLPSGQGTSNPSAPTTKTLTITLPPLTSRPLTPPPLERLITATPPSTPLTQFVTSGTPPAATVLLRRHYARTMPTDARCSYPDWFYAPQCPYEVTASMLDLVIFILLCATIVALLLISSNVKDAFPARWRGRLSTGLATIPIIFIYQFVMEAAALHSGNTLTSMVYIAPFFLNTFYSFIVLVIVIGVVALGIYQSFIQFTFWKNSQSSLLKHIETQSTQRSLKVKETIADLKRKLSAKSTEKNATPTFCELEELVNRLEDQYTGLAASGLTPAETALQTNFETNLELSVSKGISITTSVVGLATLTLSIAFLYLFLLYGKAIMPQ